MGQALTVNNPQGTVSTLDSAGNAVFTGNITLGRTSTVQIPQANTVTLYSPDGTAVNMIDARGTITTVSSGTGASTFTNLAVTANALGVVLPISHGLTAWTYDPVSVLSGKLGVAGTLYLAAMYVPTATTITKLVWGNNTVGVAPVAAQNFIGLYDSTGNRLASINVDARVTTTGTFIETIPSTSLQPGMYWMAYLFNAGTMPAIYRANDLNATLGSINEGAAMLRFATNGTGLTTLPATITPASNSIAQFTYWGAIG